MTDTPGVGELVTDQEVADYIGCDLDVATSCHATAKALLDDALADAWRPVPDEVRRTLELEVSMELSRRRDSPSGSSQYADLTTAVPVRAPRDPLAQSWPIIAHYVMGL